MRKPISIAAIVAVALAAGLLVWLLVLRDNDGEGALSPSAYQRDAEAALGGIAVSGLGEEAGQARTPAQLAEATEEVEVAYQSSIDELEDIEPPRAVADAHEQLVAALEDFTAALGEVSDAAGDEKAKEIRTAARRLPPAISKFNSELADADRQFRKEDVELPLNP
jgi:hypothetical protein